MKNRKVGISTKLSGFVISGLLLFLSANTSFAQMVGTDIFLPGHWVEIGQSNIGAFGTTSVPAGYHPQGTLTNLAEVYDYGHDGWTIGTPPEYGDYTYPGSPFEGWEIQVNGLQSTAFDGNAIAGTGSLAGNNVSYTNAGGVISALWQGTASSGNLSINQTTILDTEASWVIVTTVLKNTSLAAIPNIYYLRSCDPDDDQTIGGSFATNNTITYQNDAKHRVQISSTGQTVTNAYMGLGTKDCRAVAFAYSAWPLSAATDLATVWNQTYAATYSGLLSGDKAMGLVFNIGTLAAGDSTVLSYAYMFNGVTGIDSAFPEPSIVTLGAGHDSLDTVSACLVPSNILPVSIGNVLTGTWAWSQWSWSPAIGLTTTTGTTNSIDLTAITGSVVTYTITGTNPASGNCATKTFFLTIDATSLFPNSGIISGPTNICIGNTATLLDGGTPGGTWSVSNSTASITDSGYITGLAVGIDTISYLVSNACGVALTNYTDTISAAANSGFIVGPDTVCAGSFAVLTDTAAGGVWSCSNATGIITVAGLFSANTAGIDTIYYTVITQCSTSVANKIIFIKPLPDTGMISGPNTVCAGATIPLTETVGSGVWSSSSLATATVVAATGIVTGIASGVDTIKYSVTNSCGTLAAKHTVTVNPIGAGVITGPSNVCVGGIVTLADAVMGGTFSSGNLNATITSGGQLTGVNPGADTITYTVVSICGSYATTTVITVQPLPNAGIISGANTVCTNATITLTESVGSGAWTSSDTAIATVNAATGVVTGVSGATVNINYLVTSSFGCISEASYPITVNPAPVVNAITGITNECIGATANLADATLLGTWSSSNTTIATIDAGGMVTGIAAGIVNISYSVTNVLGCIGRAIAADTVNAIPRKSPIMGMNQVCINATTLLSDSVIMGIWGSSDTTIAMVAASTGMVTGVSAGSVLIYYNVTNNCGSVIDTTIVTVNAQPTVAPITGPTGNICAGSMDLLTDATPGGTWSSSNTAIATVDASTGWVNGIAAGMATITYTTNNEALCTNFATYNLTFAGSLSASALPTGVASLCHSTHVYMHVSSSSSGLTYQWLRNNLMIAGATNYYFNAPIAGNYAVIVGNSTCSETIAGPTVVTPPNAVVSFTAPDLLYTGSYLTYQWLLDGQPIAGATTSVHIATRNGTYQVMVSDAGGCVDTSGTYVITNIVSGVNTIANNNKISIYPNPTTSVINIDAPQAVNVKILSPEGKVLITENDTKQVNVATLANGLYFIELYDQNNLLLKTSKFTKL